MIEAALQLEITINVHYLYLLDARNFHMIPLFRLLVGSLLGQSVIISKK